VRILVRLARGEPGRPSTKHEIAEAENVSADYVEQILLKLRNAGMVASRRGPRGGFVLSRDPRGMTVGEVLRVTDGPIRLAPCAEGLCGRTTVCVTQRVWERAAAALEEVFAAATVGGLAEEARNMDQAAYSI
jgi:Rrf2 family protein